MEPKNESLTGKNLSIDLLINFKKTREKIDLEPTYLIVGD
jgi:hypothetical protein